MKFCPECGARLTSETAKFCQECGANLNALGGTTPSTEPLNQKSSDAMNGEKQLEEQIVQPEVERIDAPKVEGTEDNTPLIAGYDDGRSAFQNADDNVEPSSSDSGLVYNIESEYTKQDFIRKIWIDLARKNSPKEVFQLDFEPVDVIKHQVMIEEVTADVQYSASIGYDRQEPYIDYETYYEEEPYITTERYYDSAIKNYRTHQVTKYKQVARQRQVTRYKTVTDWSAISDCTTATSTAYVENIAGANLNLDLFHSSYASRKNESKTSLGTAAITESARNNAECEHKANLYRHVESILPGDHSQSLHCHYSVNKRSSFLHNAEEYKTSISVEDENYEFAAFPFGKMRLSPTSISGNATPEQVAADMKMKTQAENNKDQSDVKQTVLVRSNKLFIPTLLMLVASILVSCLVSYPIPVIIAFALALGTFILFMVNYKRVEKQVEEDTTKRIEKRNKELLEYLANYEKNYADDMFMLLNQKLEALGLKKVERKEFDKNSD